VVAQAEGDAQRFRSVLAEYQKAPAVTRDRLYIETMQQVYSNVSKVMVDSRVPAPTCCTCRWTADAAGRCAPRAAAPRPGGGAAPRDRSTGGEPMSARAMARAPVTAKVAEEAAHEPHRTHRLGVLLASDAAIVHAVRRRPAPAGVVYALGEIKEVITEPGLKFKLPPPLQNVVFLDKRIQTLDSPETRPSSPPRRRAW
jgi:hypothetical protein